MPPPKQPATEEEMGHAEADKARHRERILAQSMTLTQAPKRRHRARRSAP